jgi:hypothetical protein
VFPVVISKYSTCKDKETTSEGISPHSLLDCNRKLFVITVNLPSSVGIKPVNLLLFN